MHGIVVGTVGHVDHGKTALVKALTGIDCDRWEEEKIRGITIDLGFAYLRDGGRLLGFVDVPGHHKFIHNALAGLGNIHIMLLAVAADDGVMPQTREHFAVCSMMGISNGVVAVTKTDVATPEQLADAQDQIRKLVSGTHFTNIDIVPVSSKTGMGLEVLKMKLWEIATSLMKMPDSSGPARLSIDRAFHLKGSGIAVTGTLGSGTVSPQDRLELLPSRKTVRVRSVQVHNEERTVAGAGERTALQIAGVELSEVERGMQLGTPELFCPSKTLYGRVTMLEESICTIRTGMTARLHVYASETVCKLRVLRKMSLRPGETGYVTMKAEKPVTVVRGDRFVLRSLSPSVTIGGGEILDPQCSPKHFRALIKDGVTLDTGSKDALLWWIAEAGEMGVCIQELAVRLGMHLEQLMPDLQTLELESGVLRLATGNSGLSRWISRTTYNKVVERMELVLASYHQNELFSDGMPKAVALEQVFNSRHVSSPIANAYLILLQIKRKITVQGDLVTCVLKSEMALQEEEQILNAISFQIEEAGLELTSSEILQTRLSLSSKILQKALQRLLREGRVLALPNGLFAHPSVIAKVRGELTKQQWMRFTIPEFKAYFGLTRRAAIPLLEHLDSVGFTKRVADQRMVVSS